MKRLVFGVILVFSTGVSHGEVTNAQWREFLTAKASVSDPNGLYNTEMAGEGGGATCRFSFFLVTVWVAASARADGLNGHFQT